MSLKALFLVTLLLWISVFSQGSSICHMQTRFQTCIENRDGDTITVENNVQFIGKEIDFCPGQGPGGTGKPVQLMILIDRSKSHNGVDPNRLVVDIAEQFVDSIAKISPQSMVGVSLFRGTKGHNATGLFPLRLDIGNNLQVIIAELELGRQTEANTSYGAALDTAHSYFSMLSDSGYNQAVVLIARSMVQPPAAYQDLFTSGKISQLPPVYTMYLFDTTVSSMEPDVRDTLLHLAQVTGGEYFDVSSTANLHTVFMDSLIGRLVKTTGVRTFWMANRTTGQSGNGNVLSADSADFTWASIDFPPVHLSEGLNEILIGYNQQLSEGDSIVFNTIYVNRLPAGQTTPPDYQFDILCNPLSETRFMDSLWVEMPDDIPYGLAFDTIRIQITAHPGIDSIQQDSVFVYTASGDSDFVLLTETGIATNVYRGSISMPSPTGPIAWDNIIQVGIIDTIFAVYRNPAYYTLREYLDISYDTILVDNREQPSYVELWSEYGDPAALDPSSRYATQITISADDTISIYAKVFSSNGNWLGSTTIGDTLPFEWLVTGFTDITAVSDSPSMQFYQHTIPHGQTSITGQLVARRYINGAFVSDTLQVTVTAGVTFSIHIESAASGRGTEIDTIVIFSDQTTETVYAVGRDQNGNFTADIAVDWSSQNTSIATVNPASTSSSTIITKGNTGATNVQAAYGGLFDTVRVEVAPYSITEIRIVDATGSPVESTTVQTNESSVFLVQGKRSDNGNWIGNVLADWHLNGLSDKVSDTAFGNGFIFNPINAEDSGWLVAISRNNPAQLDSVFIQVSLENPTQYVLTVMGQDSIEIRETTAGDTILIKVEAYNSEGLYGGSIANWNLDWASNQSATGSNLAAGFPQLIIGDNGTWDTLSQSISRIQVNIVSGIAYVRVILINADSGTAQITAIDENAASGVTDSIKIVPDSIASLDIQSITHHASVPDTVDITNDGTIRLSVFSRGYDTYGNFLGSVSSYWSVTGDLPTLSTLQEGPAPDLSYSGKGASGDNRGFVRANYPNSALWDSVYVNIKDLIEPGISSAATKDTNGNGYLDRIDIVYNEMIQISDTAGLSSAFSILGADNSIIFYVAKIVPFGVSTFSISIILEENAYPAEFETGMVPEIAYNGTVGLLGALQYQIVKDSAGPVIASALLNDRSTPSIYDDDIIEVVWSEPISVPNVALVPSNFFNIWDNSDTMVAPFELANYLDGCGQLDRITEAGVLFTMRNGNAITQDNLISIDSLTSGIRDKNGNYTLLNNRKAPIEIKVTSSDIISDPSLGPNPVNRELVIGGSIPPPQIKIIILEDCYLAFKIFDLAGNLVKAFPRKMHLTNAVSYSANTIKEDWDLTNERGRFVARGGYLVIAFGESIAAGRKTRKYIKLSVY